MKKQTLTNNVKASLLGGALCTATMLSAQEPQKKEPFMQGGLFDVAVASEYLAGKAGFRVVNTPVIQHYLELRTAGGTFYTWSNTRLQERDLSEVDLGWVSPPLTTKHLGVNAAIAGFTYPNTPQNWSAWDPEVGVILFTHALPMKANIYLGMNFSSPRPSHVVKCTFNKGWKGEQIPGLRMNLEGAVTYSDRYYSGEAGFSHITIKGEISKQLGKGVSAYTSLTAQKGLNSFGGKVQDDLVGALGVRWVWGK